LRALLALQPLEEVWIARNHARGPGAVIGLQIVEHARPFFTKRHILV